MGSHINCTPMCVQLLVCMIAIVLGLKTLYKIVLPRKKAIMEMLKNTGLCLMISSIRSVYSFTYLFL